MKKLLLALSIVLLTAINCLATDVTFQDGVSPDASYAGTNDCSMQQESGDTNNGTGTTMLFSDVTNYQDRPVIKFDVSSIPSTATIDSAVLSLYANWDTSATCAIWVHRIFKAWPIETDVTWNDWDNTALEWTTAGCGNADDAGSDNSGDATGADRTSTANATYNKAAWEGGKYQTWTITTLVQGWVNGTMANNGVRISTDIGDCITDNGTYSSSENATTARRPKLVVSYTASTAILPLVIKNIF